MMHWRTTHLDDATMWPTEPVVALAPPNVDDRGSIQSLVNFPMKNVSLITSCKGSVRSNHYHLSDWHYMFVLKGSFDYYYRPTGSTEPAKVVRLHEGELVFTPPMEDHATIFLEDSQLIVASRNPRDQATYEADTRRVVLVDPADVTV
jgi:oxalate decarboxylase/phosphoglucose isomerase-like protein (cupin superfamily)